MGNETYKRVMLYLSFFEKEQTSLPGPMEASLFLCFVRRSPETMEQNKGKGGDVNSGRSSTESKKRHYY